MLLINSSAVCIANQEKLQNKQELNTYARGWFLFILFAILLVVWSYFFGGTFMPYRTM